LGSSFIVRPPRSVPKFEGTVNLLWRLLLAIVVVPYPQEANASCLAVIDRTSHRRRANRDIVEDFRFRIER